MAFTIKLDTNIVTQTIDPNDPGQITYVLSTATVELNNLLAYYTYVDFNGNATGYTYILPQSGNGFIVDETYATVDTLVNP